MKFQRHYLCVLSLVGCVGLGSQIAHFRGTELQPSLKSMRLEGTVGGGAIEVLPGHRMRMASMFLDIGGPEVKNSYITEKIGISLAALFRLGKFHFSLWILCFLPSLAAGANEDTSPGAVAGMEFGIPAESTRCRCPRRLSIFGKTCTSLTFW